jgi:hypothetical protein
MRNQKVKCHLCGNLFTIRYGGETRHYEWDSTTDEYTCSSCIDEEINRYKPKRGEK